MNKRFLSILLFLIFLAGTAFAKPGDIKYVNVQKAQLKSSTDFFAKTIGSIPYGEKLLVISEKDKWTEVRLFSDETITAWISNANITGKKVIGNGSIASSEIALAGKGFSKADPSVFSEDGALNYGALMNMNIQPISEQRISRFESEGRLKGKTGFNSFRPAAEISEKEEYEMGTMVASAILSVYSEQYSPQMKEYLNLITGVLVKYSPRPSMYGGYTAAVLDTDEINAFASSSGHIMITRGLLQCAASEDEIAAIIAHELGHIQLRHGFAAVEKNRFRADIQSRMNSTLTEAFGEQVLEADEFANEIRGTVNTMANNGYSQTQEFEADKYALMLLENAGYDTSALSSMITTLQKNIQSRTEYTDGGFSSTHPNPSLRIQNISSYQRPTSRWNLSQKNYRDARYSQASSRL